VRIIDMEEIEKCIEFLEKNGFEQSDGDYYAYATFKSKKGGPLIDLNKNEIVFISDRLNWLCIPCNYYALIGACIHYGQIGADYKR